MLSKPKLTILSILIIAMLAVVPIITAYDELFTEGPLIDDVFSDDYFYQEDLYFYTYDPTVLDADIYYIDDSVPEDISDDMFEEDLFMGDPYEDPITFYDLFDDFPVGDDIPDIAPQDVPTVPTQQPDDDGVTIKETGLNIQITGTRMPSEIGAGEQLMLKVYLKNNGKEKIDNLKITLVNQELALRDNVGPLDLKRGAKTSRTLFLDIPEFIPYSGYYYLRINVHSDGIDRVIYRDIYVL